MKVLKGKFFALALTFIFAVSNFSGQCVQAMNADSPMEMGIPEMTYQESELFSPEDNTQDHSAIASCEKSCNISFDELSAKKIVPGQTDASYNNHYLVGYCYAFELEDIFSSYRYLRLNKNPLTYVLPGSFQDRIKLII